MKNDTTCSLVQDLLPGYIDGVINEKSSEFVQKHLRQCEECRRAHDAMNTRITPAELHAQELVREMIEGKKRMRRYALLALIGALLIAAVCLLPLPRKIQRTCEALEWRCGDNEYSVKRTVTIDGVYYDYLFKDDQFKGKFIVEGYPFTSQASAHGYFIANHYGSMWHLDAHNLPDESLGSLLMRPNGKEFCVLIHEDGGWNGDGGLMLTGPATSREEAVKLTNKLSRKYSRDWLGVRAFE
ncbi:MAG: zf-HC2 domain-containing protein [Clostridia bacterium]|nr:zf-HC2 domain-containing protein [Clostridia bacterium]